MVDLPETFLLSFASQVLKLKLQLLPKHQPRHSDRLTRKYSWCLRFRLEGLPCDACDTGTGMLEKQPTVVPKLESEGSFTIDLELIHSADGQNPALL